MLLLTVKEWLGPGNKMQGEPEYMTTKVTERIVGFATKLPLGKAIDRLNAYERRYNDRYRLAVNFFVLGVIAIEDITWEQADMARMEVIEKLSALED